MSVATIPVPRLGGSFRRWYPLSLVYLAVGVGAAMVFPFRALFLTDAVHASPGRVTLFLIVAPISGVLAASVLGRLSDRLPVRRRIILGTSAAGMAGCLITAFTRNYWVLLLVTATIVAASMAIQPQLFAYARAALNAADERPERAAMTISTLRTVFSLSWVAGPFFAAVLLDAGGFTLVYGIAAATYALSAAVALFGVPEPAAGRPVVAPSTVPAAAGRPELPDAQRRTIWATVAGLVLLQCAATLGVQALPLFVDKELGSTVRAAGLVLGLCAALEIPLMLGFGALAARVPLRRLFLAGPVLAAAYFALVAAAGSTLVVAVAQLLNAGAIALIQGIGITYFQDLLPRHPGRASTLFSNAFPVGSTLAAPLLGAAQQWGYRSAYLACALLCAGGFALLLAGRPSPALLGLPSPAPLGGGPSPAR